MASKGEIASRERSGKEIGISMKSCPNNRIHIEVLRRMGQEGRLRKAFELTEFGRRLFAEGMKRRFPNLDEARIIEIKKGRMDKCHNRNY